MFKWKKISLLVAANVLVCATVYADSPTKFANSDPSNWDLPAKGSVEAMKVENKLLTTTSTVQWSKEQLKLLQSSELHDYLPALEYKVAGADDFRSKLMYTNTPGAKFTRKLASYPNGEKLQLTVMEPELLLENKSYVFNTAWLRTGEGEAPISLRSLQRYAQPNGPVNDLDETDDEIAAFTLEQAKSKNQKYRDIQLPPTFDSPFHRYSWYDKSRPVKVNSYSLIDSREKLEEFKRNAAEALEKAPVGKKVRFAVTFRIHGTYDLDKMAEEYNLNVTQIYATGIQDNEEEYTVSWYDTGLKVMNVMGLQESGFVKFGITELEGTANVEDLQKLSQSINVDVVEIESEGPVPTVPTGIHWLNKRYDMYHYKHGLM